MFAYLSKRASMAAIFAVICLIFPPGVHSASAAAKTAEQWSDALQKRYVDFDSAHAVFNQVITHGESGVVEKRNGEIFFKKPLLVRWTTTPPAAEVLVVTAENIWQYFPDEELAYKYPISAVDEKNAFLRVLFGLSSLEKTFAITVLPDENGLARLRLEPFAPSTSLLEAAMWLEPGSASIRRLLILDFYGNRSELDFTSLNFKPAIPAGTFNFTPPAGTEVEDQSELLN